jgi:hypothetical protein
MRKEDAKGIEPAASEGVTIVEQVYI